MLEQTTIAKIEEFIWETYYIRIVIRAPAQIVCEFDFEHTPSSESVENWTIKRFLDTMLFNTVFGKFEITIIAGCGEIPGPNWLMRSVMLSYR